MSQNIIIPGKDNKVVFVFGGVDLTLATDLTVEFGSDVFQLSDAEVVVNSATELSLDLSSTTETGKIFATITYFDGASVNGTDITSRSLGNSDQIVVAIGTQLIIEDGSQTVNANSFVTDEEYRAYTNLRGLTVASTQPDREANLIAAMDYLLSIECDMKGYRTNYNQPLFYPRTGVCLYGGIFDSDKIPNELKKAQMEAAVYATSNSLLLSEVESNLSSFSVDGVYSESYHSGGSTSKIRLDSVNAQLKPLLKDSDQLVRV